MSEGPSSAMLLSPGGFLRNPPLLVGKLEAKSFEGSGGSRSRSSEISGSLSLPSKTNVGGGLLLPVVGNG